MYCITKSPYGAIRSKMVQAHRAGMRVTEISRYFKVARSTVYRWLRRASAESQAPIPRYQPRKTPALVEAQVRLMREQTGRGPWYIGIQLSMPTSTVYKILCRLGINRLPQPPPEPIRRYEHDRPGALVHVDVKKLGTKGLVPLPRSISRHLGHQCLHVMVDDCSRFVFAAVYADETGASAAEFFERGLEQFARLGITVQRVLTDNGSAYLSEQWRNTCSLLGVRALRTRPRRPQTNGKCERWNRTLMQEGLTARVLPSLQARAAVIDNFVNLYNTRRPHKALNGKTPLRRIAECSEGV
ncbi:MAG TPA: IS481 family transposase [Trinickia sp.]|nr:IS481 family transposase [Trinickia sp.]